MSEESLARALVRGADPRRVVVVGNTPEDLESLTSAPPRPPDLQRLQGRPIVLFTGILIFDRGIVNAVRAIDEVRLEVPNVAFVIVGDGPDAPMIRDEIARLNLQHHVFLLGWQEHATLPAYYAYASVGLLPFLDRGQIRTTLANKLFDYMGAALPVIASDVPPMRRILEESGAGVLVRPNDTSELGSAIVRLLRDDQLMESMGRRGRSAVVSKYNWTVDRQRFVDAIADVFHPPPARPD